MTSSEKLEEKKNEEKNLVWGGVAVIILIIIFYLATQNSNFTVYPIQCNNAATDFSSCTHPEALARETFNADTSKSQVIETSPDTTDVDNLNYCTIEDSQHWSCGDNTAFLYSKMPGGILAATQISRSADNFNEYGLTDVVFATESQLSSLNNGTAWCN